MMLTVWYDWVQFDQTIRIPEDAPYLVMSYAISGSATCGTYGNGIEVVGDVSGSYISPIDMCNTDGWVTTTIDMRRDAGKNVRLLFGVDSTGGGLILIDDIGFVSSPTGVVDYY
jgi:hypothetical protein